MCFQRCLLLGSTYRSSLTPPALSAHSTSLPHVALLELSCASLRSLPAARYVHAVAVCLAIDITQHACACVRCVPAARKEPSQNINPLVLVQDEEEAAEIEEVSYTALHLLHKH